MRSVRVSETRVKGRGVTRLHSDVYVSGGVTSPAGPAPRLLLQLLQTD